MTNQNTTHMDKKKLSIKKGKILKIKQGYNPNSSSLGSIVFALPSALLTMTTIFGGVAGFLAARFIKKSEPVEKEISQTKETDKKS